MKLLTLWDRLFPPATPLDMVNEARLDHQRKLVAALQAERHARFIVAYHEEALEKLSLYEAELKGAR